MGLFPWMWHLAPIMWSTIFSHWWHLTFITLGFQVAWVIINQQICEDFVEWLIPLWVKLVANKLNWKPSCFVVDDALQQLWALWWVYFVKWHFLLYFHSFGVHIGWGMHIVLELFLKNWFLCAFKDCVEPKWCLNFPLGLACFESMVLGVYGENKRCGGEACNIGMFAHGDFDVHRLMRDHWVFQGTREGEGGGDVGTFNILNLGDAWTRYF
jgi:hypothetical protein